MHYLYSLKNHNFYCGGILRGMKFVDKWSMPGDTHMMLACFADVSEAAETAEKLTNSENGTVLVKELTL